MNTTREQCENCLSFNYLDDNVENLGYEAFECWNCKATQFLPDEGLFRFMDRYQVEEYIANDLLWSQPDLINVVDGRSVP